MAPSALESEAIPLRSKGASSLQSSGALDAFHHFDVTPAIGREFPDANLVDWLNAENSDNLIRDLAITSS